MQVTVIQAVNLDLKTLNEEPDMRDLPIAPRVRSQQNEKVNTKAILKYSLAQQINIWSHVRMRRQTTDTPWWRKQPNRRQCSITFRS